MEHPLHPGALERMHAARLAASLRFQQLGRGTSLLPPLSPYCPLPQTATLYKEGGGGSSTGGWRPKEFVFKVQAVRGEARCSLPAGLPVCMHVCNGFQPRHRHMFALHSSTHSAARCCCPPADSADHPRLGQEQAQTVAKAAVDLSQFCTAELTGPKQLVVPLQ